MREILIIGGGASGMAAAIKAAEDPSWNKLRAVEAEVKQLGATAENLTLAINQLSEPGQLEAHARRLGMQTPSPEQLRVVNLPDVIDDTSAQSVENTDTEESRE